MDSGLAPEEGDYPGLDLCRKRFYSRLRRVALCLGVAAFCFAVGNEPASAATHGGDFVRDCISREKNKLGLVFIIEDVAVANPTSRIKVLVPVSLQNLSGMFNVYASSHPGSSALLCTQRRPCAVFQVARDALDRRTYFSGGTNATDIDKGGGSLTGVDAFQSDAHAICFPFERGAFDMDVSAKMVFGSHFSAFNKAPGGEPKSDGPDGQNSREQGYVRLSIVESVKPPVAQTLRSIEDRSSKLASIFFMGLIGSCLVCWLITKCRP